MSLKRKYNQKLNDIEKKCNQNANVIKMQMLPKRKFHHFDYPLHSFSFQMGPTQPGVLVYFILIQMDFQAMVCLIPDLFTL